MAKTSKVPEIKTERLHLREIRISNAESYEKNFVDYEVIQHLSCEVPWPYPKGGVKDFFINVIFPQQGQNRWTWAIFEKGQPEEVIGAVDLWRKGRPENRGFWIAKKHWGKGYMTEAIAPTLDYAFLHLNFEKLIFANAVGNKRSRRIKEKTGATYVKTELASFVNPKYKEKEIWELAKENWLAYRKKTL